VVVLSTKTLFGKWFFQWCVFQSPEDHETFGLLVVVKNGVGDDEADQENAEHKKHRLPRMSRKRSEKKKMYPK
jgi:hypothetical protein